MATFCHGPWLLASAGLLHGRTLTSWPGIRDDMVGAGATWLDQPVVRDGHLITSRGRRISCRFIRGMIEHFAGRYDSRRREDDNFVAPAQPAAGSHVDSDEMVAAAVGPTAAAEPWVGCGGPGCRGAPGTNEVPGNADAAGDATRLTYLISASVRCYDCILLLP
jgi:protease I